MAKILVVDDRPLNRQFFTTLLGYGGHSLTEASDGAEALEVARSQLPDLIISDVLMPTMDGYEFVRLLREDPNLANTPVIFSTAHFLSREAEALAKKCDVVTVIYKPCEPSTVLEAVKAALNPELPVVKPAAEPQSFDREHRRLLTDSLVEKADALRIANQKLNALFELAQQLKGEHAPDYLLDQYCGVAREVVGARWAALMIDGADNEQPHFFAVGLDVNQFKQLSQLNEDLKKIAAESSSEDPIRIDKSNSVTFKSFPSVNSLLALPFDIHARRIGWLCLGDKLGGDRFKEEDQRVIQTLAAQMLVAYENAILLKEAQQHAVALEAEVSERKKTEITLRESRAQLASLIDSAMDAIVAVDETQRISLFNLAAEKMFGISKAEALGQTLDAFLPAHMREAHRDYIRTFGDTNVTTRTMGALGAVSGVHSNGREFPIEASISQVEVGNRKLYTAILRDITERKQNEQSLLEKTEALASMTQQLWQASKLATMGELAASIAHELNNPLATLTLRTDLLRSQLPADDDKQQALGVISQEVERMADLVSNLLQFSRRSHAQVSTLNLAEELASSIDLIHYHLRSRKIQLQNEIADSLPTVAADRQQLRQVFLNLLTNASDAMPNGGSLTIRAYEGTGAFANKVVVEFIDTGTGIPADQLEKIWEPFFTTKSEGKGTGLGLPICKRTIEEHRGTIDIESTPDVGTRIRIALPANRSERHT